MSSLPKRTFFQRKGWAYLWAFPVTLVGLLFGSCALMLGATAHWHQGILEIASPRPTSGRWRSRWIRRHAFVAITMGHVILGRDHHELEHWRTHEHVHVSQTERWGLFFPFAYAIASLFAWARGLHPYWDNSFEKQARCAAYRDPRAASN